MVVVGACDTICDSSDSVTTFIHHMSVVMKSCDDTFFIHSACAGLGVCCHGLHCTGGGNDILIRVQLEAVDVDSCAGGTMQSLTACKDD